MDDDDYCKKGQENRAEEYCQNTNNAYGRCRKKVKEKSKAFQCDRCSIWYHAHQKCGQEIQYVYNYISAFEKQEEEEEDSGNMIQWLCQRCRITVKEMESEMKKAGEIQRELQTRQEGNEGHIVMLQNELKRMSLVMTQIEEENRTLKHELEEKKKEMKEKSKDHELADKTGKEEAKKKQKEIDKLKKEVSKHIESIEEERREKTK